MVNLRDLGQLACPPAVFPVNKQFSLHFKEFLLGYRGEAVEVKFPLASPTRSIDPFTVGVVDGQLKIFTMIGIATLVHALVTCPLQPLNCADVAS